MTDSIKHADILAGLFAETARQVGRLGFKPSSIDVTAYDVYNQTGWCVGVHLGPSTGHRGAEAVTAVDTVADVYGLPADNGETTNYMRTGTAEVYDRTVTVNVYTGRPAADGAEAAR